MALRLSATFFISVARWILSFSPNSFASLPTCTRGQTVDPIVRATLSRDDTAEKVLRVSSPTPSGTISVVGATGQVIGTAKRVSEGVVAIYDMADTYRGGSLRQRVFIGE